MGGGMNELTVGSLFSGIGAFDLGFERAGMRTLWFCEQDEFCRRVLARHWPGVPCYPDVRALVGNANGASTHSYAEEGGPRPAVGESGRGMDVPVPVPHVDVLCGGFPCQDLSYAGRGAGIEGARSGLWSEFARLIGDLRPRYVVVENVPALLGRGLGRVLGDLAALGFDAEWDCLPASAFGAPHRRDRFWLVAYPDSHDAGRSILAEHDSGPIIVEGSSPGGHAHRLRDEVADAEGKPVGTGLRTNGARGQRRGRSGHGSSEGQPASARASVGWATEPDVGGGLDGFSSWLDGPGRAMIRQPHELVLAYADATHRSSAEAVRALRSDDGAEAVWEAARGCGGLSSPTVLFAYLRQLSTRCDEGRLALESAEAAWANLRGVWADHKPSRAPRRSGPGEQHSGERADALQDVSRLLALDAEAAWLAYRRSDVCPPLSWEAGIARVATGVPDRVDRLRALGNALVPAIAEWIGERIVTCEEVAG